MESKRAFIGIIHCKKSKGNRSTARTNAIPPTKFAHAIKPPPGETRPRATTRTYIAREIKRVLVKYGEITDD